MDKLHGWIKEIKEDQTSTIEVLAGRRAGRTEAVFELIKDHENTLVVVPSYRNGRQITDRFMKYFKNLHKHGHRYSFNEKKQQFVIGTIGNLNDKKGYDFDLVIFHDCNPSKKELSDLRGGLSYYGQIYIFDYRPNDRKTIKVKPTEYLSVAEIGEMQRSIPEEKYVYEYLLEDGLWQTDNSNKYIDVEINDTDLKLCTICGSPVIEIGNRYTCKCIQDSVTKLIGQELNADKNRLFKLSDGGDR